MKLTVDLGGLENLRKKMGAKQRLWVSDEVIGEHREAQTELQEGISTDLADINITNGGLLSYKGEQIVVYIKDHTNNYGYRDSVLADPENGRRIHIYDCSKLEEMRQSKRYDRYVQTSKVNQFPIEIKSTVGIKEYKADLKVCQICLKALKFNGYTGGKNELWRSFDLEDFLGQFSTFFAISPRYHDYASPSYEYTKNWSVISRKMREEYSWKCSKCPAVFSSPEHQKFLHVHHDNGVKSDNSKKNLIPLCVLCHSKEPSHQHMRVSEQTRRVIEELRLK